MFTLIVNEKIFSVSSYLNIQTGEYRVEKYNHSEPAYVDHIKIIGNDNGTGDLEKVCFVLRIQVFIIIGIKFFCFVLQNSGIYNYWDQILLFCPQNSGTYIIIGVKFFRSCDEKGHVSYCHRFASVVIVVISLW